MNAPLTPQIWHQTGQYTIHREQSVFFHDAGGGEALLLLHGFPTSSFDWYRLWPYLTARYQVLAPDFVGFGYSAKLRRYAYVIHDQVDWVEALLRERGVTACHLLVHDYGNTVAQELLARFAERQSGVPVLRSCCFLNGGLFPEMYRALPVQKLLNGSLGGLVTLLTNRNTLRNSLNRLYAPPGISNNELDAFWYLVRHNNGHRIMHRLIHYINDRRQHRDRWVGNLQTTTVPLHLIDGPEDPVSGRHMAEYYQQLVPHADVVLLPGVGHYPQTEAPEAMLRAYLAFREKLESY